MVHSPRAEASSRSSYMQRGSRAQRGMPPDPRSSALMNCEIGLKTGCCAYLHHDAQRQLGHSPFLPFVLRPSLCGFRAEVRAERPNFLASTGSVGTIAGLSSKRRTLVESCRGVWLSYSRSFAKGRKAERLPSSHGAGPRNRKIKDAWLTSLNLRIFRKGRTLLGRGGVALARY